MNLNCFIKGEDMRNIKKITISFIILMLIFNIKSYAGLHNNINDTTDIDNTNITNTNTAENNVITETVQNNTINETKDTTNNIINQGQSSNTSAIEKLDTDTSSGDIDEGDDSDEGDDISAGDLDEDFGDDDTANDQEQGSNEIQASINNQQKIASQNQITQQPSYSNQRQNLVENTQIQNNTPHTGIEKAWIIPGGIILIFNAVIAIQKIKKYRGI